MNTDELLDKSIVALNAYRNVIQRFAPKAAEEVEPELSGIISGLGALRDALTADAFATYIPSWQKTEHLRHGSVPQRGDGQGTPA